MSAIEHLLPWTQQPQEAARVDWTNPLTRGLAAVQLPDGRNLASGMASTDNGAPVLGATPVGRALVMDRAAPYRRSVAVSGHASDATLLCVGAINQGLAGRQGLAVVSNGTTRRLFIGEASASRYSFTATPSGGSEQIAGNGAGITSLGRAPQVLVGVVRGTTISLYRNGIDEGNSKTIASQNFSDATSCSISWDGFLSAGDGYVGLVAYWVGRALTDDEIAAISANPWQLFEPRRIWVPVAAGGGGSWSVSLTETASANDSLAAATTALVSLIESASAADIITAATIAAVALTEAASASDTQTASYSATGSGSVTELASASDTLDAANTMLRALTETASADDQLAAATTMLRAISESASASDDASASYTAAGAAAITETASATDALTAAATLLVTILEAGSATDALAAATTMVRAITEQATAIDTVAGALPGSTWDVSIEELAAAVDLITGYAAGGLTVSPLGLRLSTTARQPRLSTRTR